MNNKDKIAIVVVGYNRINSMKRLLSSLLKAKYSIHDVPLCICIDASGCLELYDYVNNFEWPFGEKFVNIQPKRLGLKDHILKCGDYADKFKAIILLEDDIYVSEYFYDYVLKAVDYYYNDDRIAGISLYRNEVINPYLFPVIWAQDGSDAFLRQSVASWGECWTDRQWSGFKKWYSDLKETSLTEFDMPSSIKKWKRAWSKYFIAYEIETGRYFLYPSVSHTTCFSEAGENNTFTTCIGQTNLLCGPKEYNFRPYENMVKYDVYSTNIDLYEWIGLSKDELCIDFDGENDNIANKRYLLTTHHLPFDIIKSYGLCMRPIELNIKEGIEGNDIFLYDTKGLTYKLEKYPPVSLSYYFLRHYSPRLLVKYLWNYYCNEIMWRVRKRLKIH